MVEKTRAEQTLTEANAAEVITRTSTGLLGTINLQLADYGKKIDQLTLSDQSKTVVIENQRKALFILQSALEDAHEQIIELGGHPQPAPDLSKLLGAELAA